MLRFFEKKPVLALGITARAVRVVVLSGRGAQASVLAVETADLPAGVVEEEYAAPNILDFKVLSDRLGDCLARLSRFNARRAALSLPDRIFRIQMLEFDELPPKAADRERLLRWRLEKAAAFDTAGTVLRYRAHRREGTSHALLACAAKANVIGQYESLLRDLGVQPWSIGPASFHALDHYAPLLPELPRTFAFAYISDDAATAMVADREHILFYRWKEVRRASSEESRLRLIREISDSIHFYTHRDRAQFAGTDRLFLAGTADALDAVAEGVRSSLSMDVAVLPAVLGAAAGEAAAPAAHAALLGAGGTL